MDTRTVSMESKGVMQEIREHLESGKTSGEIIAMGYKPPTVYKVQRQERSRGEGNRGAPAKGRTRAPAPTILPIVQDTQVRAEVERLKADNEDLRAQLERLEDEAGLADTLRFDLDEAQAQIQDLEGQVKTLRMNVWVWQEAKWNLDGELSTAKAKLDETERSLRAVKEEDTQLRAKLSGTERSLHAAKEEGAQLRAYLASKNCGWQEDFAHWRSHRSIVLERCTLNQGGQQAHGCPSALRLGPCTLSKAGS